MESKSTSFLRKIAKDLSTDFKDVREARLKRLFSDVIKLHQINPITPLQMLQLWKGLFLLLWNTDKIEPQLGVINDMYGVAENLAEMEFDDKGNIRVPQCFEEMLPKIPESTKVHGKRIKKVKGRKLAKRKVVKETIESPEELDTVYPEQEQEELQRPMTMGRWMRSHVSNDAKAETTGVLLLLEGISGPPESKIRGIEVVYPHGSLYFMFVRSWILTLCREMGNIDVYRMDKFLSLLRASLRVLMTVNAKYGWGMGRGWTGEYDQSKSITNDVLEGSVETLASCVFNAKVLNGIKDEARAIFIKANIANAGGRSPFVIPPSIIGFISDKYITEMNRAIMCKTEDGPAPLPSSVINDMDKLKECMYDRVCPCPNSFTQMMLPIIQFISDIQGNYLYKVCLTKINDKILTPTGLWYVAGRKTKKDLERLSTEKLGFPLTSVLSPDCPVSGGSAEEMDDDEEEEQEERDGSAQTGSYLGVPSLRQIVELASGAEGTKNKGLLRDYSDALWVLQKISGLYREGGEQADKEEAELLKKINKKKKHQAKSKKEEKGKVEFKRMELVGAFREDKSHGWKTVESKKKMKQKLKQSEKNKGRKAKDRPAIRDRKARKK